MNFIIYKLTNLINYKIYVGYTTVSVEHRFAKHVTSSKKPKYLIQKSIKKYGKDNFSIEQIDSANSFKELLEKEIYWIANLNSTNLEIGYNMTKGGEGQLGRIQSEEEKSKRAVHYKKPIKCLETSEEFPSIIEAAKSLNLNDRAIINNLKGLVIKTSGLSFEYLNEENVKKKQNIKKRPIICITTNEIFESVTEAARNKKISRSNIKNVLSGRDKETKGLAFKYA